LVPWKSRLTASPGLGVLRTRAPDSETAPPTAEETPPVVSGVKPTSSAVIAPAEVPPIAIRFVSRP